jgi:REP element-mobilizing transposase RayT
MARQKRLKSETGIYHVMLRGINKQQVFFDDDDYFMFLDVLSKCKIIGGFKLHAYCLMNNHVHLLIQEGEEPLAESFKRMGDMFVYWYNSSHKRSGAVFQGRYKSIPVNDDEYYISVIRYIHQNPVKAGIVESCSEYKFSSYNSYFKTSFVDTGFALELIGIDEFIRLHNEPCCDMHLDIDENETVKLNDIEAQRVVKRISKCESVEEFKSLPDDAKKEYVELLKQQGVSVRQLVRLTGVSYRMASK